MAITRVSCAEEARVTLGLDRVQFAELLGVSQSDIIIEELRSGDKRAISDALYVLIVKDPTHVVRVLIEERLKEVTPHSPELPRLMELNRALSARKVI